ncbi:MAG: hypothetical protein IJS68_00905 [Clostridia bacterium]|nr:hypothetical protein [Clostridia bacterium]
METSNLARIINRLMLALIAGIFAFIYIKHFLKNVWLSCFLAGMVFSIILTELFHNLKIKNNRLSLRKAELKHMDSCLAHFLETPKQKTLLFFKRALHPLLNLQINKDCLFNIEKQIAICPCYSTKELSEAEYYSIIKTSVQLKASKIIILCGECKLIVNQYITVLDKYETYALLKELKCFPIKMEQPEKRKSILSRINSKPTHEKAKPFFIASGFLFISSLLVPQKVYYIVASTICFIIAMVCLLILKKQNPSKPFELALDIIKK